MSKNPNKFNQQRQQPLRSTKHAPTTDQRTSRSATLTRPSTNRSITRQVPTTEQRTSRAAPLTTANPRTPIATPPLSKLPRPTTSRQSTNRTTSESSASTSPTSEQRTSRAAPLTTAKPRITSKLPRPTTSRQNTIRTTSESSASTSPTSEQRTSRAAPLTTAKPRITSKLPRPTTSRQNTNRTTSESSASTSPTSEQRTSRAAPLTTAKPRITNPRKPIATPPLSKLPRPTTSRQSTNRITNPRTPIVTPPLSKLPRPSTSRQSTNRTSSESSASSPTSEQRTSRVSPPRVSPPRVSPPRVSPPRVSPPRVSPPRVSPPRVSPPRVSPPRVSPPRANPPVTDDENEDNAAERPNANDIENPPLTEKEKNERVKAYFSDYNQQDDTRKCNRCPNNTRIKGTTTKLKQHLSSKHKIIARALGIQQRIQIRRSRQDDNDEEEQPQPKKLKIISINKTISDLVEFFLSANLSFNVAEKLRKVEIIKREFDAYNKTFNRRKIKDYVMQAAGQDEHTGIYKEIAKEVKGKMPSLMFDSASRHGRHVFSVSLRFVKEDKIVERTIGLLTQRVRQTARQLLTQIDILLRRVGLTFNDIYSTCTDQGANMLKTSELLAEAQEQIQICRGIANIDENQTEITEEEINQAIRDEREQIRQDNYMLLAEEEEDREEEERLRQQEDDEIEEESTIADVVADEAALCTTMVCGAHTCHLAVKDVTKNFSRAIEEIRTVVKESKKLKYHEAFHNLRTPIPHIDVETRWDSMYDMINNLNNIRDNLEIIALDNPRLVLSDEAWNFINEYLEVFRPVHFAMKDFQRADISISEFFIRWLRMEYIISNIQEGQQRMKTDLLNALQRRKQKFIDCEALIAALVLDPYINWSTNPNDVFNKELLERGILHLEKIHQVLNNRQQREIQLENQERQVPRREPANDIEIDDLIRGGGNRVSTLAEQQSVRPTSIRQKINLFLQKPRLLSTVNISPLKYWYDQRDEEPEIYKISQIVYGAAFSQVKVERDFSGFALVLTHLRTLLADNTLNAIIVCKYNLDLLKNVKFTLI